MPKNLFDVLSAKPQRETVGASTAARFDYQKSYALLELINRHTSNLDYSVAFEFHDDILFFDSETNPNLVEFTQVKTSSSNSPKKTHTLTTRRKKSNSILGKLMANAKSFPLSHDFSLVLVSNNPFEFSNTDIKFQDLDATTKSKISDKLKDEFKGIKESQFDSFKFKVTNISIENMDTHLRGKVVDLFEKEFGPNFSQNILSWLRLLIGEVKRKNNYPPEKITSGTELLEQKCISRSLITYSLENLRTDHNPAPEISQIHSVLLSQGWSDAKLFGFAKKFPIAVSDYQDPTNIECQKICEEISDELDLLPESASLTELISSVLSSLQSNENHISPYHDDMYLSSIIAVVYYAKL